MVKIKTVIQNGLWLNGNRHTEPYRFAALSPARP